MVLGFAGLAMPQAALNGPSVTYTVEPARPVAKAPFRVVYDIRWQGGPGSVGVIPAEPAAVVWGTARLVEATTVAMADGQWLRYAVEYVADKTGEYAVPPLALSYVLEPPLEERPKVVADASAQPPAVPVAVEPLGLEAPGLSVKVRRSVSPVLIGAGIGVTLVAASFVGAVARRRRRARLSAPPAPGTTLQTLINAARQHRLDGKFYEYYRELARASQLLAPSIAAKKLRETLEHRAEQVGYGALRPHEDDLEGALRDLERVAREHGPKEN